MSQWGKRLFSAVIVIGTFIGLPGRMKAADLVTHLDIQAQAACEAGMLRAAGAREIFSGKSYHVLTQTARAYGRPVPHIYLSPGSWNMAYIAGSTAVDGRGKILVGKQAIKLFNA